jgi:Uma2 family endonuclease
VVQPDILVVCDPGKITSSHIEGAPDLIVEVLSPGTSVKDLRDKKALYERGGVREYLVVDPLEQYAIRFLLVADGYDKGTVVAADEVLRSATLETVEVPLWEVFEVPGPAVPAGGQPEE